MIYKAIKYILENNTAFATAIGSDGGDIKAYPVHPRKEVALPFCVFNISSQRGNYDKELRSVNGIDEISLRVHIFDYELNDVIDLAEKARIALENYKEGATVNGVQIVSVDFETLSDGFAQDYGDRGALFISMDFNIWARP